MSLLLILLSVILLLIFLTTTAKVSPFIAFILVSFTAGILLGMPLNQIAASIQKGIGDMLGSVVIILAAGAMIGKLVAGSGAATVIADNVMRICGERYLQWGLLTTGLLIGIPLFYNVGFVLVVPVIFSLVYRYKLPLVYVAIPVLASLSVAHSLLPPHPSPASMIGTFQASMIKTFLYGIVVAIPAVILAGPLFSRTLKGIKPLGTLAFVKDESATQPLPGIFNSLFSAMLPVFLLLATFLLSYIHYPWITPFISFIREPAILMIAALIIVTITLGLAQGKSMKQTMGIYEEGIKDIAMILLIIGASGGLKQIMIDSAASETIGMYIKNISIHPLLLGWLLAAILRISLGSATVAGLTTAGIIAPLMGDLQTEPNLMILAIGSGSIFCSHVNDTGFWMFKEYFNLSVKDTFLSWSLMESIVSLTGLAGIMMMNLFV